MQPSPIADTSKPLSPNMRFCIVVDIPSIPDYGRSTEAGILILRNDCLFLGEGRCFRPFKQLLLLAEAITILPKNAGNQISEARADLARKVNALMGFMENRITEIPGLTLFRYTAPHQASIFHLSLLAWHLFYKAGSKSRLGQKVFIYDGSRFLLTSLDLPVLSQVVEASEDVPYLCLRLKLEMAIIREFLGREELEMEDASSDAPAMTTAQTTV